MRFSPLVVALSLLAGCGSSEPSPAEPSAAAPALSPFEQAVEQGARNLCKKLSNSQAQGAIKIQRMSVSGPRPPGDELAPAQIVLEVLEANGWTVTESASKARLMLLGTVTRGVARRGKENEVTVTVKLRVVHVGRGEQVCDSATQQRHRVKR